MTTQISGMNFVMHGARTAIAGGMGHMEEQVRAIEGAVPDNPGLAIDLSKTIVESACRTILTERGVPYGNKDDLPRLFKVVIQNLPLLPPNASSEIEARRSLEQTLGGLHGALQGICELRNQYGFASHGRGAPQASLELEHALLAAQTADTIVGFLNRVHRQGAAQNKQVKINFDDHAVGVGSEACWRCGRCGGGRHPQHQGR